ncbi:MAG: OmpA family protein [Bacteroidota bacterium]|nr:OmpA family protein [Bacteroidota bacterium]MDP4228897.1 OmpA family protein [Bacteroidota bacterium]
MLILAAFSGFLLVSGNAYSQKHPKHPPKKQKDSTAAPISIGKVLEKSDSLVVTEVNLPLADSADDRPMFSLDGNIMVFGSRRPPMPGEVWRQRQNPPFNWDGDIYYRVYTDTGWSIPINAGQLINNGGDQNNPTISPGGDEVVFVSNGGIYRSKFISGALQKPELIPGDIQTIYAQLNQVHFQYQQTLRAKVINELNSDSDLVDLFKRAPETRDVYYKERLLNYLKDDGAIKFFEAMTRFESAFTPDGKYVIFSENFGKKGQYGFDGDGDDDLWALSISPRGRWDTVRALNGRVNSPYSESYPFAAADGTTIYFSSNRPCQNCPMNAWGTDDIYMTRLVDTGFTQPVALPYPINSTAGDYGLTITADGQTAYFLSNRTGKSKLYQVRLRSQDSVFTPKPVILMHGSITDAVTGKPIRGQIFVDELTSGKNTFSVTTNDSGIYTLAIQRGHRIGLEAMADGHLPKSERFTYPASGKFDRRKLDFQLSPIEVGSMTEFKNVYFESGKSDLLPESRLELDRVVDFLKKNKNASVEIDGHTDDVGSDASNNALSLARATSVMNYLSSHGTRADRMTAKGFGKTKPLKKGTDEESRAKNRRVEMVISAYSQ